MARDLYEEMLAGGGDLGALATAARELRAWRATGLAEQEFQDGLHAEGDGLEESQQSDAWSMAAQDTARSLPATYGQAGHEVVVARGASGELYMELTAGGPLMVGGQWLHMGKRVGLEEVPQAISAVDEQANPVLLT